MQSGVLRLPAAAVGRLRELSEAAWPEEACGLLEGPVEIPGVSGAFPVARRVSRVVACRNLHPAPRRRFQIDPERFLRVDRAARERGRAVIGVWHSHPHGDARPSPIDRAEAWPGWSYLIVGVTKGDMTELRCWQPTDGDFLEQDIRIVGRRPECP